MLTVGSLFSGIGGFDLGFERAGMRTLWQVEQSEFCRRVLAKHFPEAHQFCDVRHVTGDPKRWADEGGCLLEYVDVLCGGFPCQDLSFAGRGAGMDGERSGLWSEYARLIGELRPRYVVVENVSALLVRGLGRVLGDLAEVGYDAEWDCLPAFSVGAPHRRDRIWLLAYPNGERGHGGWPRGPGRDEPEDRRSALANAEREGLEGRGRGTVRTGSATGSGTGEGPRGLPNADSQRPIGNRLPEGRRGQAVSNPDRSGPRIFGRGLRPCGEWPPEPPVGRVVDGFPGRVEQLTALGNSLVPQIAEWIGRRIIEWEEGGLAA